MQKLYVPLILMSLVVACQPGQPSYPVKDIGFIYPENIIDPDAEFRICGTEEDILQYYNHNAPGDKPAGYIGGPKAIKKYLKDHYPGLDLHHDSGMLTIRFIINCEGKTGHFEMFENDLDFKPTSFHPKTCEQLLEITRELRNWRANQMEGSYRDSFMYITYRIENGKITEILP
ncbi:MAG: hypothetical protein ACPF9D_09985 [Owenweeksia sp.]